MSKQTSRNKLSEADIAVIKAMIARGDAQMDIATWFGINVGRISEINTGFRPEFRRVQVAPITSLPPKGPYKLVEKGAVVVEKGAIVVSQQEATLIRELLKDLSGLHQKYAALMNEGFMGNGSSDATKH